MRALRVGWLGVALLVDTPSERTCSRARIMAVLLPVTAFTQASQTPKKKKKRFAGLIFWLCMRRASHHTKGQKLLLEPLVESLTSLATCVFLIWMCVCASFLCLVLPTAPLLLLFFPVSLTLRFLLCSSCDDRNEQSSTATLWSRTAPAAMAAISANTLCMQWTGPPRCRPNATLSSLVREMRTCLNVSMSVRK
jgi:hypothetical protein